jgi:hypothetical protein
MTTKSDFNDKYELWRCSVIQDKVAIRMQKFTQSQVAEITGTSLRTVQLFENYKSENMKLMYFYMNLAYHLQV